MMWSDEADEVFIQASISLELSTGNLVHTGEIIRNNNQEEITDKTPGDSGNGTNSVTCVEPNSTENTPGDISSGNGTNSVTCVEPNSTENTGGELSSGNKTNTNTCLEPNTNTCLEPKSIENTPGDISSGNETNSVTCVEPNSTESTTLEITSGNKTNPESCVEPNSTDNIPGELTGETGTNADTYVDQNITDETSREITSENGTNVETCVESGTTKKGQDSQNLNAGKSSGKNGSNVETCAQTNLTETDTKKYDKHVRNENSTEEGTNARYGGLNEKARRNKKRKPTRKKLRYVTSSSDEDVPLSVYARKYQNIIDSDIDELFVPNKKDMNSTDSEYSSNLSSSAKRTHKAEKGFKRGWEKAAKHIEKKKMATTSKKAKPSTSRKYPNSDSAIQAAERVSFHEDVIQRTLIAANEGRLNQILTSEGYKRIQVPPHGNCFFEAACTSNLIHETQSQLRDALCRHLEENSLEYMGFMINKHSPEDEEEFVCEYLSEIECLKRDGYWSNKVADLLPLALANYASCTLTIFTSKPDQPKIVIEPNMGQKDDNRHLHLAYISIPSVLEHYDGCLAISNSQQPEMTATKLVSEQDKTQTPTRNQTPKKTAKFVSPVKKRLFRKRKAMPQNWKKNVRKRLRISGEEYIASTGKVVKRKNVKECDCLKCKYKCNNKVSFEQRCTIRDLYYGLTCYERQMDYICANVLEKTTKSYVDDKGQRIQKKKQVSRAYSFVVDNENFRVCKKFFLNTLSISQATVNQALLKKVSGHFQGKDERGRHKAPNKTSDEMLNSAREHIESFPVVDSHYTRKSTKRQFLAHELNIKRMYEAYVLKCAEIGNDAVKEPIYRRIFNEEYNMSFHVPKKDQCILCNRYNNSKADGTLDENTKEEYLLHQQRKTAAREQKYEDSNRAKQDIKVHTCTFDLQSVLYTPCSLVSLMYYMRKLCCYDLSIYSAGDKTATCYLWSETEGKRGSNEISTCLNLYLKSLEPRVEHAILYSDACTGQNRNQIVATCLLHSVSTLQRIQKIDHKFLESGHTHMECDSMHSAIEFAKSKTRIFVPSQWETVLSMARRKKPYHVVALKYQDFKDFKAVELMQAKATKTEKFKKPKWTNMKWMRFLKDEPETCFFKYSFDEAEDFQRVKLASKWPMQEIQPLYKTKLPVSSAKKKDLITLCKQGIIPAEYQDFYKGLPASQSVKERLPEPDKEESEVDTDVE